MNLLKLFKVKNRSDDYRFRRIFENSLAVMLVLDPETRHIVDANYAAENFYGWKREQLCQMRIDQINTLSAQEIEVEMEKGRRSERNYFNFKHRLANGQIRDVEAYTSKITIDDKDYLYTIIHDITVQKNARNDLIHSHNLMRYIIEHDRSGVAVFDKNLNYIYVSQRYLNEYHIHQPDIIGKHHYEIFPEMPDTWKNIHQQVLAGAILSEERDPFVRENGETDWVRWECRPWYEADGSIGGMILYSEIINERIQRENEIRALNSKLEILIDSVKELSSAQTIEVISQIVTIASRKLTGSDGAAFIVKDGENCFYVGESAIMPLWAGKRFAMSNCISGWVMASHEPAIIEDIYGDGRVPLELYRRTFIKSLVMIPVNTSEPVGAIGNYWKERHLTTDLEIGLLQTLADASSRAIENINLYTELEQRVKQRTAQLEAVNRELETFTYSVSHDLKAPLRGIEGYSKLLAEEHMSQLNEEAQYFVKTIRNSALQMDKLINDLLEYSRLERTLIRRETIRISSYIDMVLASFQQDLSKNGFVVEKSVPDIEIQADNTALGIALRNIIGNAIKFSKDKPNPCLVVTLSQTATSWILCIKDNGMGFDMKYRQRIFDIFQRLQNAQDSPGTGIGLAMVQKAMLRMNGKVWAESVPEEGSVFYLEIPFEINDMH